MGNGPTLAAMARATPLVVEEPKSGIGVVQIHHLPMVALIVMDLLQTLPAAILFLAVSYR